MRIEEVARSSLEFQRPRPRGGIEAMGFDEGGDGLIGFCLSSLLPPKENGSAKTKGSRNVVNTADFMVVVRRRFSLL